MAARAGQRVRSASVGREGWSFRHTACRHHRRGAKSNTVDVVANIGRCGYAGWQEPVHPPLQKGRPRFAQFTGLTVAAFDQLPRNRTRLAPERRRPESRRPRPAEAGGPGGSRKAQPATASGGLMYYRVVRNPGRPRPGCSGWMTERPAGSSGGRVGPARGRSASGGRVRLGAGRVWPRGRGCDECVATDRIRPTDAGVQRSGKTRGREAAHHQASEWWSCGKRKRPGRGGSGSEMCESRRCPRRPRGPQHDTEGPRTVRFGTPGGGGGAGDRGTAYLGTRFAVAEP